jgi:hypothetical protein
MLDSTAAVARLSRLVSLDALSVKSPMLVAKTKIDI